MRIVLMLSALLLTLPAWAQDLETPPRLEQDDYAGAAYTLARAEQVISLVRSTRQISVDAYADFSPESDLRVSMIVLDNGAGTDVSPRHDLHLAMFNVISEYGMAWALEPIVSLYAFTGVARTAPGIYVVEGTILQGKPECYFVRARITLDARALSVAVRRARGLAELDVQRYAVPVGIETERLGCTEL